MNPTLRAALIEQMIYNVSDTLDHSMIREILDQSYGFSKMSDDELIKDAVEMGFSTLTFTLSAVIEHLESIGWSGTLIDRLQEIVIDLNVENSDVDR